jgi:hypothetical protein
MSVPEAAVDKYGNSSARKDDIGTAGQILAVQVLVITKGAYESTDNPFRRRVPRLHLPHDGAALSCGKRVHIF